MNLTVIPQDEINYINKIQDYILSHPAATVGKIKERFILDEDEYKMAFDFCMPCIRNRTYEHYWITRYKTLYCGLEELLREAKELGHTTIPVNSIRRIFNNATISDHQKERKEVFDECEVETINHG